MTSTTHRFIGSRPQVIAVGLLCAAILAGCGTSRGPAPILNRTGANAPARPPEVPAAPAEVVPPPPVDNGVTSAPIRSGGAGVEVRPLESRPLDAPSPPPMSPGAANIKVQPKLLKRPYSDVALAEMQAADAASPRPSGPALLPTPSPAAPSPAAPETKADMPPPALVATAPASAGSFAWPAKGKVIQPFADPRSLGIVIDGTLGDPVSAAGDGKVIFSGPGPRGYGNLVIIKHDDDTVSVYGHNRALTVKEGQAVKRGQKVAELGDSDGNKPNLLFEVRKQGKPVDPLQFLPKR